MTAVRPQQIWTQGEIQTLDLASRTLTVAHQPIPEWQWPAMEMDFAVADGVDMSKLVQGQRLHLQVEQQGDEYRIVNIHVEDAPASQTAPAKDEMKGMENMEGMDNHGQHQIGDKP
ncbi:Cation efflux system protein CusF precursor [compost metagenome]